MPSDDTFILTRNAVRFELMRPNPSDVRIEDIAYALARINRFTGHAKRPYSVAEHSLLVVEILERAGLGAKHMLLHAALLHDAHEAYTGDIATPLKRCLSEHYHALERGVVHAIEDHFGIAQAARKHWIALKHADLVALATERRDLMPPHLTEWACLRDVEPVGWIDLNDREGLEYDDWELAFMDKHAELAAAIGA